MSSKNFFSALDDSDDENEVTSAPAPPKTQSSGGKTNKTATTAVADPSKPERRRQHNNDRNTKSGRNQRPPARDGKRTYDRRSGTGRGKEIKKGGGGARNWGSDKNDAKNLEGAIDETVVDEMVKEVVEGAGKEDEGEEPAAAEGKEEEEGGEKEEEPVVVEEEDKTMSYDEYLEFKKTQVKKDSEAFKAKQEKELENEFAGMNVKAKVEEEELFGGGAKKLRQKGKPKKTKEALTPGFRVNAPGFQRRERRDRDGGEGGDRRERRGGGGGGRGRGDRRDGRGRDGGRGGGRYGGGGYQPKPQLDVADMSSFPSLG